MANSDVIAYGAAEDRSGQEGLTIEELAKSPNLVDVLPESRVEQIGLQVLEGYRIDKRLRADWEEEQEEYHRLASQMVEEKTFPWPKAANVKYPLLTIATIQFASRAYAALVPGRNPARGKVTGYDESGEKHRKADRIGKHMSWQLMEDMPGWEEDQDTLLHVLPIAGCVFKKTYNNPTTGKNVSELVLPMDLVVPMYAKSLETSPRLTHIIPLHANQIVERQRSGAWVDFEIGLPSITPANDDKVDRSGQDQDAPHIILEQHCWCDLDEDGYKEPYIVTMHEGLGKVTRIVSRIDDIQYNDLNEIARIEPEHYFEKYSFIPAFDGSFYDYGFGKLLGPINETVNTTINQLIDAGTLSNMQSGFLGRGMRIKAGANRFTPGEWKFVDTRGQKIADNVFPLPVREPSNVLFTLLGLMIESGKEIASIVDIMLGQNPGQNTAATTVIQMIEQGQKVYQGVYKRIHRAFGQELKKLYRLNKLYLPYESVFRVLDHRPSQEQMQTIATAMMGQMVAAAVQQGVSPEEAQQLAAQEMTQISPQEIAELAKGEEMQKILKTDYQGDDTEVQPTSDPNAASEQMRRAKADFVIQSMRMGAPVSGFEAWMQAYEAYDIDNREQILVPPDPNAVPFEAQMELREQGRKDADVAARINNNTQLVSAQTAELRTRAIYNLKNAAAVEDKTETDRFKAEVEAIEKDVTADLKAKELDQKRTDGMAKSSADA